MGFVGVRDEDAVAGGSDVGGLESAGGRRGPGAWMSWRAKKYRDTSPEPQTLVGRYVL